MSSSARIEVDLSIIDCIVHALIWILLIIVTLGIGAYFYPYALGKFVINKTSLIEADGRRRRFRCDLDLFAQAGHVVLWLILTVVTLGLAGVIYMYRVRRYILEATTLEPIKG